MSDKDERIAELEQQLAVATGKNRDMVRRNAFLRERHDLPADRIPAYNQMQGEIDRYRHMWEAGEENRQRWVEKFMGLQKESEHLMNMGQRLTDKHNKEATELRVAAVIDAVEFAKMQDIINVLQKQLNK